MTMYTLENHMLSILEIYVNDNWYVFHGIINGNSDINSNLYVILFGRNIAVIRHRYAIYVLDINVNHVLRQCLFSQPELTGIAWCILELLRVSNNEIDLPGFTKKRC